MNILAFFERDTELTVILGFVAVLVIIKTIGKVQRQKLWHDTARIALDKGQPLPPPMPDRGDYRDWRRANRWQRNCQWGWYRGLIWIAVAAGLYLVDEGHSRRWAILPACVGAALLIAGLIGSAQSKDDNQLPPSP